MLTRTDRNPVVGPLVAVTLALLLLGPAMAQAPPLPPVPNVDVPFTPALTTYAQDFELDDGGFTTGGSASWEWGTAATPPDTAPGQGPGMWGTSLSGDYGANECGWIESPAIDLSDVPAGPDGDVTVARLAFKHWLDAQMSSFSGNAWDGGVLMASADGESFSLIEPIGGYTSEGSFSNVRSCFGVDSDQSIYSTVSAPDADAWETAEFDVSSYLGGNLHVRWVFTSSSSTHNRGWYVDDVVVQLGAGASVAPPQPDELDLPSAEVPFTPVTTAYGQDFELDDGGYSVTGTTTSFEWGQPSSPPEVMAGQGPGMWGTHLDSDYESNECTFLTSEAIDLSGYPAAPDDTATLARLSFKHWIHAEMSSSSGNAWDGGVVMVSSDGENFQIVEPLGGYTSNGAFSAIRSCFEVGSGQQVFSTPSSPDPEVDAWETAEFDVTRYLGGELHVRWGFASDGIVQNRGWYVDDVAVQVGVGVAPTSLEPQSASCTDAPGWESGGASSSWCYGAPTTGPFSNKAVWATNLHGDHNEAECSWAMSGPIETDLVPGLGQLRLSFEHYMRTTTTSRGGVVQVSNDDGITWTTVTPIGGYPESLSTSARACLDPTASSLRGFARAATGSDYEYREVNLASYQGDTIRVRFAFASGTGSTDDGWYVRSAAVNRGLGSVPIMPTSGEHPLQTFETLLEKSEPGLREAILGGQEQFELMVTGHPHEGFSAGAFSERSDAMLELDAYAAPFLAKVSSASGLSGGALVKSWSAAPAVKVVGDLELLMALARLDETRHFVEDDPNAVQLIEPIPDEGVDAMNSEGRKMLQAEDIWAAGFEGEGITIAVIDTGVDARHEAFKFANGTSRIAKFADCVSGGCDDSAAPYDDHGHGTHVSGTAAGSDEYDDPTHGTFQERGVAPKATLYGVKFLSGSGGGSFEGAMDALQWSFDNDADLTSNSWGGSCSASSSVVQLVNQLTALGMLNIFAAGNSGSGSGTIGGPACADTSLSVGAVDKDYNIASFSSRGPCSDPTTDTGSRICPDVVAKGVSVRSAIPRDGAGNADPSGYKTWQGTSMATPHIAGAVALAEEMKRHYSGTGWDTPNQAEKEVFKLTAIDLGDAGEDNTYGWGHPKLLNILAILDASEDAVILSSFGVSDQEVRLGESTQLSFSVRNMGSAIASGDFLATLEHPDGNVETLKSSTVSLGLLDGEAVSHTLKVSGNVLPGNYTFRGTFAYTWTNNTTGDIETGLVEHVGDFTVKRVFIDMALNGLAGETLPLDPQSLTFTATSTGNDGAGNTRIEFTVSDDYVFLGGDDFDPLDAMSRYASPAPDQVVEDSTFGRVTLVWDVGDLPVGESFSFTTRVLPTMPGTYNFLSVAKFQDGAGANFSQVDVDRQTVAVAP